MFKHSLLLIYRNFRRFKSTFFINLIGLSTGMACALLIYLWVSDELNVDKFHENDSRLYQVMENSQLEDGITTQAYTPDLLAETMAEEIPEVEYAAGVTPSEWFAFTLSTGEKKIKASGQFAGKDYFNVFSYDFLQGDKADALSIENGIVISIELAQKLFNTTENVIGRPVEWHLLNFDNQATVTGLFKGTPRNSTAQFDFVLSYKAWIDISKKIGRNINWDNHAPHTYVVLKKGTDIDRFNEKIAGFIKSKNKFSNVDLISRRYSDGYLYSKYENGVQAGGRIKYVELFSIIAVFIILIACINFMNLSTAKASRRIKEVGIKKAVGASRKTLILQYLGESMLMALLSLIFSFILVEIFLPQFNEITGKHLVLDYNVDLLLPLLGITLFTGLIAGSYPALYISGFHTATVLKGILKSSAGELWARKGLVVFQFVLSIILIVSVLVVYKQIDFIQSKNLGYEKDNIIYFEEEGKIAEDQDTFLSEVKNINGVVNASSSASNLMGSGNTTSGIKWEGKNPKDIIRFEIVNCNYDLIETLGIKMKEGRTFSREFGSEDSKVIFNEAAIDIMGLKDPVGKMVNVWGNDMEIIGVTKNFNFESLHENVKPLFFKLNPPRTLKVMVKVKAGMEREVINELGKFYKEFNPGYSFNYKFLDQDYEALYEAESRIGILSRYFAGVAIVISCMGLFGLAAFSAERRQKEIGIRKVLGSSEFGIVYLLTSEFTKIVFISGIVALPLSYLIAKNWLESFAYRIDLEMWYFIGSGLIALFIAWFTVGMQAVKASRINPAVCLRDE